jgi:hypothetical protein
VGCFPLFRSNSWLTTQTEEGKRANASPSVVPQTTFQGYLQVSNAETNEDIGFISKNWLSGGAYPRFQETLDEDALLIRFNLPTGAESGTDVEFQIDVRYRVLPLVSFLLRF